MGEETLLLTTDISNGGRRQRSWARLERTRGRGGGEHQVDVGGGGGAAFSVPDLATLALVTLCLTGRTTSGDFVGAVYLIIPLRSYIAKTYQIKSLRPQWIRGSLVRSTPSHCTKRSRQQ